MDDSVGLLCSSNCRVALADDVLVVVAQLGEQLGDEAVDGDLTLLAGVANHGKLIGAGCRLDNASGLEGNQALLH